MTGRRVLVVDERLPANPVDGGSVRMARLLEVLASLGFTVTAIEMVGSALDAHLDRFGERYDAVVLSRPATATACLDVVRRAAPQALVVYDTLDLHFVREYRRAKLTRSAGLLAQALERKRQELDLVRAADRTLVVSEVERSLLAEECPGARVHVVSNIHPVVADPRPFAARSGVVFVGAFGHLPNVDAVEWLLDEVWPLVRAAAPLNLTIVGHEPPAWLVEREDATIAASVPEVAPYLDAARLTVAPLRFGAGVKGKVLESMGRGVPVVGTPVAFEGIAAIGPPPTADPAALAHEIVRAHSDPELWKRLSEAGRHVVARSFSPHAARSALASALAREAVHA